MMTIDVRVEFVFTFLKVTKNSLVALLADPFGSCLNVSARSVFEFTKENFNNHIFI
jgi:hypothetical protein